MKKETKESIVKLILSGAVIGLILLIGYFILKQLGILDMTREEIQAFIESTGVIAPIAFIAVSFLQVTFVPIPSTVSILAGNYIFGPWLSFIYSYIGIMLGAMLAFALGRLVGRPYINWVAGNKETADEWLAKLKGRETVFLFFAFLFPAFPDDLLCSVAGILPISFTAFLIMQLITRVTAIGGTLLFMSGELIPYEGWGLVLIVILVIIALLAFVLSMKYAVELNDMFDRLVQKANAFFKRNFSKK